MHKSNAIYDAIILAAGAGVRFGGDTPKQFARLGEYPVVKHSIRAFQNHPLIRRVILVIAPEHQPYIDRHFSKAALQKIQIMTGAATRNQSVMAGLNALAGMPPGYVLIHDGARPLVTEKLITNICTALQNAAAVIPVLPVTDTIKEVEGDKVTGTIDRTTLRAVQTPTGFHYGRLCQLMQQNTDPHITEESLLFEKAGEDISLAEGEVRNIKITYPQDLALAQFYKDNPS